LLHECHELFRADAKGGACRAGAYAGRSAILTLAHIALDRFLHRLGRAVTVIMVMVVMLTSKTLYFAKYILLLAAKHQP